jgi:hypothetical protein
MSWASIDGAPSDARSPIPETSAPTWMLGIVLLLDVMAVAIRLFWGLGGAGVGYFLGLSAFTLILVFRRRHGVLSQTSFVNAPPGLTQMVVVSFLVSVVVVLYCVWPIATEVSRG